MVNIFSKNKKYLLVYVVSFLVLFSAGVAYAYSNKPKDIKYGSINIQAIPSALTTLEKVSYNITSTKPGIKISLNENKNNSEMFYDMLNGNVDVIITSREMDDSEEELAKENNISYKKLPFAHLKDKKNTVIYMYINDMNYNHKPENKALAKNFYGPDRVLVDESKLNPLDSKEYDKVIDYLTLIDEF